MKKVGAGYRRPVVVLAPFSDRVWRRVLALAPEVDLFTSIVKNRGALLVAAGALEAGPGTREWLAEERGVAFDPASILSNE